MTLIAVADFRRTGMILQWHTLGGTWTALDNPPALLHGVALIRPAGPNVCVFGQGGRLMLQIGPQRHDFTAADLLVGFGRNWLLGGFRRRFWVKSASGEVLFDQRYWSAQRRDFFRWLAGQAKDPAWAQTHGRLWSAGVAAAALRPL